MLLPLVAGVGGATAYTAWMQTDAHTAPLARGGAGAGNPAAATGGMGPAVVDAMVGPAGPGASGRAGRRANGGAARGASGGLGADAVVSAAISGMLVAAVAGAFVLVPSVFPSAPTPTSAPVADHVAPSVFGAPDSSAPVEPPLWAPTDPSAPAAPATPSQPRPEPPVLADAFPGDGFTTRARTLAATGTAVAGATVAATATPGSGSRASSGSALVLGNTVAGADGSWGLGLDLSALDDGTWTMSFTQTTTAGTSDATTRTLVIVRTALAPQITSVDTGSGASAGYAAPIVSGTAEPGATVDLSDGNRLLSTVTADGTGSWTTTELIHVSPAFSLTARQTDVLGNLSAFSEAATGTVLAPSVAASSRLLTVTIEARGRPNTGLLVYEDGEDTDKTDQIAADGTAILSYDWTGTLGAHRVGYGYDFGDRRGIVLDVPITVTNRVQAPGR